MLQHLLTQARIVSEMKATEHWPAIVELVDHLIDLGKLEPELRERALEGLEQREKSTSTGIGSGVAIPHAFLEELEETQMVFGRSKQGIEFDSLDSAPVRFVFLFLVPKSQHGVHLSTLASVARTLSQCQIRRDLNEAKDAKELFALILDQAPSNSLS